MALKTTAKQNAQTIITAKKQKKQTYVLSFNFFAVISLLVSFRCKLNLNQFEKIRETDHQTCSSVA